MFNRLCPFAVGLEGCTHVMAAQLTADCHTHHARATKWNVRLFVSRYEIRILSVTSDYSKWPCDNKLALPTLSSSVMQPLSRPRSLQLSGVLLHKFWLSLGGGGGITRTVWYVPWFTSDLPRKFGDKIKICHDSSCRYPVLQFDAADIWTSGSKKRRYTSQT